jgi:DHA2 family multidrug resistance protein
METDFWQFGPPLMLVGIASALLFVPLSVAVLGATTPSEGPKAGAMINLAIQLGGSVLIALLDVVIDRRMTFHSEVLAGAQSLSNPTTAQYLAHGGTLPQLTQVVNTQALVAFADVNYALMGIALLCIPLVFLMRKPKASAGAVVEIGG